MDDTSRRMLTSRSRTAPQVYRQPKPESFEQAPAPYTCKWPSLHVSPYATWMKNRKHASTTTPYARVVATRRAGTECLLRFRAETERRRARFKRPRRMVLRQGNANQLAAPRRARDKGYELTIAKASARGDGVYIIREAAWYALEADESKPA